MGLPGVMTPINGVISPGTSGHYVWLPGAAFEFLPEHPCRLTFEQFSFCYQKDFKQDVPNEHQKKVI